MNINWIFDNIRLKVVAEPTKIVTVVKVKRARKVDHLRLVPAENCVALVPDNVDSSSVSIEPIPETLPESVAAPIKKGEVMGKAIVKYANSEIARVDLVAAEDVELSYLLLVLIILAVVLVVGGGVAYIYVKRSRSRKSIRQFKFTDIRR